MLYNPLTTPSYVISIEDQIQSSSYNSGPTEANQLYQWPQQSQDSKSLLDLNSTTAPWPPFQYINHSSSQNYHPVALKPGTFRGVVTKLSIMQLCMANQGKLAKPNASLSP